MNDAPVPEVPKKLHPFKTPLVFTIISAIVFAVLGIFGVIFLGDRGAGLFTSPDKAGFERFTSEQALRDYLTNAQQNVSAFGLGGFATGIARDLVAQEATSVQSPGAQPDRVSTTNVQVPGLDEPDIVKTDGRNIFVSTQNYAILGRPVPLIESRELIAPDIFPPPYTANIKVVAATPPQALALSGEIEASGDLLLSGNTLMVIEYNKVTAFNVASVESPKELWSHEFDENFSYNTARLMDGKLYLVTTRYADYSLPCPMPLYKGVNTLTIACTDIYRPIRPISANSVYSIVKLEPSTGAVEESVTFLGESASVVYMSPEAIYATFVSYPNPLDFMASFMAENRGLFGDEVVNRINNLRSIDISNESKLNELNIITQRYLSSLSNDERRRIENELANRMNDYAKAHGRELQITSLVKIDVSSLDVAATGEVPGAPLNQFSLDEHNGNLRIATTVSANSIFGGGESANDLYVLDGSLNTIGQIQGLALGERIYSARFIGDRAYLVTFKQVDPFFVIDLANPASPRVAGELKIPGFSSYLHPLSEDLILGVGQEESQSKLSVFNVSSGDTPIEFSKYLLDEFYSEVQNNHHAFLHDPVHKVFFLPAGQNGYIFSWEGGLVLERVVSNISARRAVLINNYLYVVGDDKIVVLNEETWEETSSLEF